MQVAKTADAQVWNQAVRLASLLEESMAADVVA